MMDLIVIGAGLSGLMAAYTAAQAGLRVQVIAKGLGSMHWAGGSIDVLGYLADKPQGAVKRPLQAIASLAQGEPQHPYALIGVDCVKDAIDSFARLIHDAGLPYVGAGYDSLHAPAPLDLNSVSNGDNWLLISALGAERPCYLVPVSQAAGDLTHDAPIVIVSFEGVIDFFPFMVTDNLRRMGKQARRVMLPLDAVADDDDIQQVHMAQRMEEPRWRERLGKALRKVVQPGERIGMPAILGVDNHVAVWSEVQSLAGAPIFEIPGLPPSIPGIRLFKKLLDRLTTLGVRFDPGLDVYTTGSVATTAGPRRVEWVGSATSSTRPLKHYAQNYLLATGGLLGGGFDSNPRGDVWEVIFHLPLTTPQHRYQWFRPDFLDVLGQPVFKGGIAVTPTMQPRAPGSNDQVLYENLWTSGGCLASVDPVRQRSVEGIDLATGLAAARAILAARG